MFRVGLILVGTMTKSEIIYETRIDDRTTLRAERTGKNAIVFYVEHSGRSTEISESAANALAAMAAVPLRAVPIG